MAKDIREEGGSKRQEKKWIKGKSDTEEMKNGALGEVDEWEMKRTMEKKKIKVGAEEMRRKKASGCEEK